MTIASLCITEVPGVIRRAVRCGFNVDIQSPPSRAKTAVITQTAAQCMTLPPDDHDHWNFFSVWNGGALTPLDLTATMPDMETGTLKRLYFNALPNAHKTPDLHGVIYVGERGLTGIESERQLQKIINHEEFGDHTNPIRIPDHVIFVSDGNLMTDKSGAQAKGRAVESRYDHYILRWEAQPYLEYALAHYHPKIGAFLKRHPDCIDNYGSVFDPEREANSLMAVEGKAGVWACTRTWERLSLKMQDAEKYGEPLLPAEYKCVGEGMAATFHTHLTMLDSLTSFEEIVRDPKRAELPKQADDQFTLLYMLAILVRHEHWKPVSTYVKRMNPEMQTVFLVSLNERFKGEARVTQRRTSDEGQKILNDVTYIEWSQDPNVGKLLLAQLAR